jgi:hypothetical protein
MKRRDKRRGKTNKTTDHKKLPVGKVLSDPVKGEFLCLPLFGWIAVREKVDTPLVMLVVMLFKSVEDPVPRGTLQLELPVFPETELGIVAALDRFGWDGRIWPRDEGWPDEGSSDEDNLKALLKQAKLRNTLVFPTGDEGSAAQSVNVQRARGPFLMPPLPKPEVEVDPWKRDQLRKLCEAPELFYHIALVPEGDDEQPTA